MDLGYELELYTDDIRATQYKLDECLKETNQLNSRLDSEAVKYSMLRESKEQIEIS